MRIVGHGIDIVEVARIQRVLDHHPERFLARCYTLREQELCAGSPARLAGRFAAKEAVLKALGTGLATGISWTEVEIDRNEAGGPVLRLHGLAHSAADRVGVREWVVTISHTRCHAVASAIACA